MILVFCSQHSDVLTTRLTIDDRTLRDIFRNLYYPNSPYEFSVLPVDVLGQVYEQFLGKVITLTSRRSVEIEEKPEVRKAGGVYYTPTYIVDYIVEHTVGKLLEGKSPRQAEKLKIVDPACGSGSFLIGAYQYLLTWHRDRYLADGPGKHAKKLYQAVGGEWRLTTDERKRILTNNIYGVDIDPQAVEVTKLSLMLKLLEGETSQTLNRQLSFLRERVLPDMGANIKCGNSLIGPDFYDNQQMTLLPAEDQYRINVFDWDAEFPETMKQGGFDAVIGNPPYLNIDDTWGKGDVRQRYISRVYRDVYNDKTDILFYFLKLAVQSSRGLVGFIVSRAFLEAYKADKLRGWLADKSDIVEIVDFRNFYVFSGVGITTAIVILAPEGTVPDAQVYRLMDQGAVSRGSVIPHGTNSAFNNISVKQSNFGSDLWLFGDAAVMGITSKLDAEGDALGQLLHLGQGMQTGRNKVFGKSSVNKIADWNLPEGTYYIRARNSDIHRYRIRNSGELLLYLEDVSSFKDLPAAVQEHLSAHEEELKARAAYQRGDCDWWRYTWPLHKDYIRRSKLYCPYLATSNRFALDESQTYLGLTDTTVLYDADQPEQLRYIMGLLNSRLLTFRFKYIGKLKSNGILEYFWNSITKLPIRRIDFASPADVALHDQMVSLVERMLALNEQVQASSTSHDRAILQRQIEGTDRQIDRLVYQLYELTDDEIAIVEAETAVASRG